MAMDRRHDHYDEQTGNYIVTRWTRDLICSSKEAAELLASDLSDDEVNKRLTELSHRKGYGIRGNSNPKSNDLVVVLTIILIGIVVAFALYLF